MTVVVDQPEHRHAARRARPYALTGGRTRPQIELPLEATVEAVASGASGTLDDVGTMIVALCGVRQSVAEVSSHADMPIGVTRVLIADLVESGHLRVHATLTDRSTAAERRRLIERTRDGLRTL
jgi:uncharacterized protein DUF742